MSYPLLLMRFLIHSGIARFLPGVQRRLRGGGDFLRYYSDRLLTSPLAALELAASALQAHGAEIIDLSRGAPRFDLLPSATTKLPADRRDWPVAGGLPELRAAVADKLRADNGLTFDPAEEVLITAGALGAIHTALDTFVNRGDRVVLLDPASPLYPLAVQTRGARMLWLPTWMENGRTRFHLDRLARALRQARMLLLNLPVNPTGGIVAAEDLEQIAWWADRHDVLILSDEVFERYDYDGDVVSIGSLPLARRRTLTVGSVSKDQALTAARVGWLAAHRHLLQPCRLTSALRTPFVPTLCQQLALSALRNGPAFSAIHQEFRSRRHYAFERLRAMELNPPWPAGAFFFWVPVWELGVSGREFTEELLREKGVLVTPGDLFGPSGVGYVRLSYAVEDGRLQEGLNRLAEYVHELQPAARTASRRAA